MPRGVTRLQRVAGRAANAARSSPYGAVRGVPPPPPRCVPELTEEILCFANQMRETPADIEQRDKAISHCKKVLKRVEPGARVHMFGSCVTGLRLPHGDVDLMIEAPRALKHEKRVLQRLAQTLRARPHSARPSSA